MMLPSSPTDTARTRSVNRTRANRRPVYATPHAPSATRRPRRRGVTRAHPVRRRFPGPFVSPREAGEVWTDRKRGRQPNSVLAERVPMRRLRPLTGSHRSATEDHRTTEAPRSTPVPRARSSWPCNARAFPLADVPLSAYSPTGAAIVIGR